MNSFKLGLLLAKGDKTEFDVTVDEQKKFLYSLPTPKDDIERSFFQYKCQGFFIPRWKKVFFNFVALLIYIPLISYLLIKGLRTRKTRKIEAIGEFRGLEETIPQEVQDAYIIDNDVWDGSKSLVFEDLNLIFKLILKYPLQTYFTLKCALKIAMYSCMIKKYSPNAIIVHNEYSFTSSILTFYCSKHGVKHINAMHGEKYYFIRDAFFHYDECYVWDEYYVDLFKSLCAEPNQFIIAVPPSLKIDTQKYRNNAVYADYKYYLDIYSEEELREIIASLEPLQKENKKIIFRPHPRYSDIEILRKYVSDVKIEYPQKVNILESVSNLEYAIGSCTTVLSQAYYSGKKVILDDVTYKRQYDQLDKLGYILSNKEIPLLSFFSKNN